MKTFASHRANLKCILKIIVVDVGAQTHAHTRGDFRNI